MRIELISQEQYDTISEIQKAHPFLTYENVGYDCPRKPENDEEVKALETVEAIFRKHIVGFSKFNNFRIRDNSIQLRIQYNWGYNPGELYFIGAGYLMLDELLHGFEVEEVA